MTRTMLGAVLLVGMSAAHADEGWTPLFNGRDLSGWARVNCAPETFAARDGLIVTTGKPTGVLRTTRMYENFVLELEYKHLHAKGNSGLYVWSDAMPAVGQPFTRAVEVQVLDGYTGELATSHGDVFAIHGAVMTPDRPHPKGWMRCLPSEHRARPAGEWNHYRVECNDGNLKLAVNGKVVSGGSRCSPRKGYLCLESEGSECHFRNLRIRELPGTNPRPEEVARADEGFTALYSGLDLRGWKDDAGHWQPKDWILDYDGKGGDKPLRTDAEYGDFVLMFDWRWSGKTATDRKPPVLLRGAVAPQVETELPAGRWNRCVATVRGDRLTVVLNGKAVLENAQLTDVPGRGPVALQPRDEPVQFANLFIKELR